MMTRWVAALAVLMCLMGSARAADRTLDSLIDELALGTSPKEAIAILAELGKRKDGRALDVLELYANNRTPEVRRRALESLAEFSNDRAHAALVAGLSDGSPEIRAYAAQTLAKRKGGSSSAAASMEAKLLRLLEKNDPSAPAAVAAIATPELAHRLSERLGQLPDGPLASTFGEILKRPDFTNEKVRGEIVKTLAKMPGADSTVALQEYVASSAKDKTRPSRVEAEKVIEQRSK